MKVRMIARARGRERELKNSGKGQRVKAKPPRVGAKRGFTSVRLIRDLKMKLKRCEWKDGRRTRGVQQWGSCGEWWGGLRGHWMGLFSMCNYERYYTSGRTESVSPMRIHVFNDPDTMCEIRRETLTSVGGCVWARVCVCVFLLPLITK